jgi:hypothetical protein
MFTVTRKTDPQHAAIVQALAEVQQIEQFPYNDLCQGYNELEVGEIIDFPFKRSKQTSLIQQLERREISRNIDYRIVFESKEGDNPLKDAEGNPQTDEEGNVVMETYPAAFITRLSTKPAVMVVRTSGKRGEEGAKLTDDPIPPTGTTVNTDDGEADAVVEVATAPKASLGTATAPKAPVKAPPATKAVTKGAPPKPPGKR